MDIKIDKPAPACRICAVQFKDNESLETALKVMPPQKRGDEPTFERHDICNRCWPKQDEAAFRCHWTSQYSAKRRSPLLDAGVLWQVFHRSHPRAAALGGASLPAEEEAGVREAAEFAYVAALGLMRLKQLTLENTRREGAHEVMVFRTRGKNREIFTVFDPKLDESGIERVQDKLADFEPADNDQPETAQE